jgi:Flp pilus assembly protein TadD
MSKGLFIASLTLGLLATCSSSKKAPEGSATAAAGGESLDDEVDQKPLVPESKTAPTKETVSELQTKSNSIDGRYKPMSVALRAGQAQAVNEEAAKLLGTNPDDPTALNALAMIHLRRGKIGAAKLLLSRALEKNPQNAALHNNLGVALLEEGEHVLAMSQFKKALQLDDRHTEALGNLGSLYVRNGDFVKAASLLDQSYRQNRANHAIATNLALALRHKKDFEGAKRIYEEILKANSRDVSALLNYAILLIDFMGKPKDGLDLVYKLKFIETERKDVLNRANALEKKAKSELK